MSEEGNKIAVEVKVGDRVVYAKYTSMEFKLDNEELIVVRESDILAKRS